MTLTEFGQTTVMLNMSDMLDAYVHLIFLEFHPCDLIKYRMVCRQWRRVIRRICEEIIEIKLDDSITDPSFMFFPSLKSLTGKLMNANKLSVHPLSNLDVTLNYKDYINIQYVFKGGPIMETIKHLYQFIKSGYRFKVSLNYSGMLNVYYINMNIGTGILETNFNEDMIQGLIGSGFNYETLVYKCSSYAIGSLCSLLKQGTNVVFDVDKPIKNEFVTGSNIFIDSVYNKCKCKSIIIRIPSNCTVHIIYTPISLQYNIPINIGDNVQIGRGIIRLPYSRTLLLQHKDESSIE